MSQVYHTATSQHGYELDQAAVTRTQLLLLALTVLRDEDNSQQAMGLASTCRPCSRAGCDLWRRRLGLPKASGEGHPRRVIDVKRYDVAKNISRDRWPCSWRSYTALLGRKTPGLSTWRLVDQSQTHRGTGECRAILPDIARHSLNTMATRLAWSSSVAKMN